MRKQQMEKKNPRCARKFTGQWQAIFSSSKTAACRRLLRFSNRPKNRVREKREFFSQKTENNRLPLGSYKIYSDRKFFNYESDTNINNILFYCPFFLQTSFGRFKLYASRRNQHSPPNSTHVCRGKRIRCGSHYPRRRPKKSIEMVIVSPRGSLRQRIRVYFSPDCRNGNH